MSGTVRAPLFNNLEEWTDLRSEWLGFAGVLGGSRTTGPSRFQASIWHCQRDLHQRTVQKPDKCSLNPFGFDSLSQLPTRSAPGCCNNERVGMSHKSLARYLLGGQLAELSWSALVVLNHFRTESCLFFMCCLKISPNCFPSRASSERMICSCSPTALAQRSSDRLAA